MTFIDHIVVIQFTDREIPFTPAQQILQALIFFIHDPKEGGSKDYATPHPKKGGRDPPNPSPTHSGATELY